MTTLTDTKPDRLPFIETCLDGNHIGKDQVQWLIREVKRLRGELITAEFEAFAAGMESRQDNEVQP